MLRTKSDLPKFLRLDAVPHHECAARALSQQARRCVYLAGTPWSQYFMAQNVTALDGSKALTELLATWTKSSKEQNRASCQ